MKALYLHWSRHPRVLSQQASSLAAMQAADDAFARNCRHIAAHEAKPQPRPLPAEAVTLAFEGYAYGKIVS